jgi:hypothetical protein
MQKRTKIRHSTGSSWALSFLVVCAMGLPGILAAQCSSFAEARFGGRSGGSLGSTVGFFAGAETIFDLSRPARQPIDVSRIDFSSPGSSGDFSIRFVAVRPSGTRYTVVAQSTELHFTGSSTGLFSAALPQPLHFEAGDLLGAEMTATSAAALGYSLADNPGGFAVVPSVLSVGASGDRDSFANFLDSSLTISMEAFGTIDCSKIPPFEVIVPVGDLVGGGNTHYRSNLDMFLQAVGFGGGPFEVLATLRDRLATPGSVHLVSATSTAFLVNEPNHVDSIADLLGTTPPFFGTLSVAFPFTQGFTQNWENNALVSSTISAATAACSGGGTGSTLKAVGCHGIGRAFFVPFHVSSGHRLNIGIASTKIASCGAAAAATSVTVRVLQPIPGSIVTISMPGESTQLNDVTSPGSLIADAIGLTDGILEVRVADEASRILVYTVLQDNVSQDTAAGYGLVEY